ncbi:AraC family transcriptional regulator [Paenibacillus swuensis]|nr:AraC family transcriptional regulator [Paenibacillus swuensis]
MTLDSIGWSSVDGVEYSFDGRLRPDQGHVIFQYTLSGEGRIEIGEQVYRLPKGTAFFVQVPGEHRYYYEQTSEPWEFLWLNVKGADAQMFWDRIQQRYQGELVELHPQSQPIQALWDMYRRIQNEQARDKHNLSVMVYNWILLFLGTHAEDHPYHAPVQDSNLRIIEQAQQYMKNHLSESVSLDDIAEHCGTNKYQLCRIFQKTVQVTPLDYMTKRRIEAAAYALRNTNKPVSQISEENGFGSVSYFGKRFREQVGLSPTGYREQSIPYPTSRLYVD